MEKFCSVEEVYVLVEKGAGEPVDSLFFNSTINMMCLKCERNFTDTGMDLADFLVLSSLLQTWYKINTCDVADFIDKKFKEKYEVTRTDILGIISRAMEKEVPAEKTEEEPKKSKKAMTKIKPKDDDTIEPEKDMYKIVQKSLKSGMTKVEVQKKYGLSQRELVQYEGYAYWSDEQKADHKAMLKYCRTHPDASKKELIEKGAKKSASGYRYSLVPTKEQQEEYNKKISAKINEPPKASIKGDIKSLILSDTEKEEQQELYSKIKEIANARNCSPREITSLFKSRLVRNYGIVIDQIKKDLMIKYKVNRGEGKAPNTLEAIVMSEYLPIAKSVLDSMYEESFNVK